MTSNGQDWKFVFARNTKLHVGSEGAAWVETLDSYRLVGTGPGTMSSQALADVTYFQRPADTGVQAGLEFVLHVLPGGTAADYFVNGHGTRRDVVIATVGDTAFVVGLWAKTARGARALWLAGGAAALEASTGLYAGGQGVYDLSQGDLTGATRSGIEAMLILWGLKGDLEDVITRLKTPKLTNDAVDAARQAIAPNRPPSPNRINPSVPAPEVPPNSLFGRSFQDIGRDVVGWGTGAKEAAARMQSITLQELQRGGVTAAQAQAARDFYSGVLARNPGNAAAAARVQLMDPILQLLGGG